MTHDNEAKLYQKPNFLARYFWSGKTAETNAPLLSLPTSDENFTFLILDVVLLNYEAGMSNETM